MVDWALLALRIVAAVVLYLFLGQTGYRIWQQARRAAPTGFVLQPVRQPASAQPLAPVNAIGRAEDNSIILTDDFVSAHHATLARQDGIWWLADLGSTNGTRLNDKLVQQRTRVRPGDVLQFGRRQYRLERRA